MMKGILFAFLLLISVPAVAKEETSYDRVMASQTLRCGYIVTEALQKNPNTGVIEGIIPDILAEAARLLNLKIEWTEELNWGNFVEALRSRRVDAICTNFWMEPNAAKDVFYTIPLYYSGLGAYVRADETRFKNGLEGLNDPSVRVSAMDGEMSGLVADQDYPLAKKVMISQLGDASQLLMDVADKKADVAFLDVAIGKRFERNNPGRVKNLVPAHPVRVFANTIAIPSGDVRMKSMLDATLSQLLYGGFVSNVLKKHINVSEGYYPVAQPYEVPK